ncbi:hypothetical protein SDC9_148931 [bioreactor metagenome]|uniref:Uncharacterized protein n=1 Tax=bioreactor metagenome TaxID=1076179 RepID=A0A645EK83_9ZZZZ
MTYATVGPDRPALTTSGLGALQHRAELRAAHPGLHPGRAHGTRADADLQHVRPGGDQIEDAGGGDDVAGDDRDADAGTVRDLVTDGADGGQRLQHPVLVAVRSVDDEDVGLRGEQGAGAALDVAADADRGADHQASPGICGGLVDRGPDGALAGHDAEDVVAIGDHRHIQVVALEGLEHGAGLGVRWEGEEVGPHHLMGLGEAVHIGGVLRLQQADGPAVVDDHRDTVCALVDDRHGLADRGVGGDVDRRVEDRVGGLDPTDRPVDLVGRDVLGQDRDPAAAGHCLGHPAPRDRRHVGHDDR